MKKIEKKIIETINKNNMLSDGDTVVVAVSGGADSMCLLWFFNKFSSFLNINIICAHVNHGIRGEEADRDEAYVQNFCAEHKICFECAHFDVPSVSAKTGESVEECGRRLRYDFFASLAETSKIATAHNLNDSAETFIFNLARGTGIRGLCGIPTVRDNIIRPLSDCTRDEIEQYLAEENIDYVTDSTNISDDYARNKIRHNVLPVLCEINPSFFGVFSNCIDSLRETDDFLSDKINEIFKQIIIDDKFPVSSLKNNERILRTGLLKKIAEYYGAYDVGNKHIILLDSVLDNGGAVVLHGKVKIASDGKFLFKENEKKEEKKIFVKPEKTVSEYCFDGCTIIVDCVDKDILNKYNIKELSAMGIIDADKFYSSVFRNRIQGDRFRFPFAEHSKSLKNLYKEKKISVSERWGIPILADGDNNILWINGVGTSHYGAVTEKTDYFVSLKVIYNE